MTRFKWLKMSRFCSPWPISTQYSLLIPPEIIRKPKIYWYFQWNQMEILGWNWSKNLGSSFFEICVCANVNSFYFLIFVKPILKFRLLMIYFRKCLVMNWPLLFLNISVGACLFRIFLKLPLFPYKFFKFCFLNQYRTFLELNFYMAYIFACMGIVWNFFIW